MKNQQPTYTLIEYVLTGETTLDTPENFGDEICTDDRYAHILDVETHSLPYLPPLRPGDFWRERVVSAISYQVSGMIILTLGYSYHLYRELDDIYIFCKPLRPNRIGVIRAKQEIMKTLPSHPDGGHTWGYGGSGPGNTCESIWTDMASKPILGILKRNYPAGLNDLFRVDGVLPQDATFAIPARVIQRFIDKKTD